MCFTCFHIFTMALQEMYYPTSQMKGQVPKNEQSCSRSYSPDTGLSKLKIKVHSTILCSFPNLTRGRGSPKSPFRIKVYCKIQCPLDMERVGLAMMPYYVSVHFICKICQLPFTSKSQKVSL